MRKKVWNYEQSHWELKTFGYCEIFDESDISCEICVYFTWKEGKFGSDSDHDLTWSSFSSALKPPSGFQLRFAQRSCCRKSLNNKLKKKSFHCFFFTHIYGKTLIGKKYALCWRQVSFVFVFWVCVCLSVYAIFPPVSTENSRTVAIDIVRHASD